MGYARRKPSTFLPLYRGQSFRYFAVYRHPEMDTANTLAVSQDKVNIIKLPRRSLAKPGKPSRDLTTVETRPIYGACLLKVPFGLALDRKMDFEWPTSQLLPQSWHGKDMRTYTRAEQEAKGQYYEFADAAEQAFLRNGGGIRHTGEPGGAYHGHGA